MCVCVCVCEGMNECMAASKSQNDDSVNSLSVVSTFGGNSASGYTEKDVFHVSILQFKHQLGRL